MGRQNYARAKGVAIDLLVFDFTVTKTEGDAPESITSEPKIGVYVYGLFMEGMKWDREAMQLGESAPKVLYDVQFITGDYDWLLNQCVELGGDDPYYYGACDAASPKAHPIRVVTKWWDTLYIPASAAVV